MAASMTTMTKPKDMTPAEKRAWRAEQLRSLRMEIRIRKELYNAD